MILRPFRKSFLVQLAFLILLMACEQDEIAELEAVNFKFNVSDEFIVNQHQSVLIISDYEGEVLVTEKLNSRGIHELDVPGRDGGVYHVTILDGNKSFRTFASVPFGEYDIDVAQSDPGSGPVGTHQLLFQDPTLAIPFVSGGDLLFARMISRGQIELNFTKPSSDTYVLFEREGEPRYLYYPALDISQSTTITPADYTNGKTMEKRSVQFVDPAEIPNITLTGSIEPDSRRMEYSLSNSNGAPYVFVPTPLLSKLKFFTTTFAAQQGGYTYGGPGIASHQKALNASVGNIAITASSVFYTIESPGSSVSWIATSPGGVSWEIVSQPGGNVKVNLPKLSQEFQNGYSFGDLQTLTFVMAFVKKDTRYESHLDYVKSSLRNDFPVSATAYEQFYQQVNLPN